MTINKVLIVDDTKADRRFFILAFIEVNPNIELMVAPDCKEALALLHGATTLPDLICMDTHMPFKDGFECFEEIKREARFTHIPIIICSGSSDAHHESKAIEKGAAYLLTKPVNFEDLPGILKEVIESIPDSALKSVKV